MPGLIHRDMEQAKAAAAGGAGNTGSISAGGVNATLGQVIFSNSNGVSFGIAGQTLTASVAAGGAVIATSVENVASASSIGTVTRFAGEDHRHRGLNQFQITGNTLNTSNLVYGSIYLAGGNNITLSQVSGVGVATVTISAANETQTVPPIGTQVFAVATAGSTGTLTRFAPEDHRHVGLVQAQITGNTLNTSNVVQGSLYLAGGNNITLSQVSVAGGATITISAANETQTVPPIGTAVKDVATAGSTGTITRFAPEDHAHRGLNQFQITGNTSNTSNLVYGSLWLAGGNNITLSQVSAVGGATVTISAGAGAGLSAGVSTGGNTSGNTTVIGGRLVLAGGNNITLSGSSNADSMTVTISAGAGGGGATVDYWFMNAANNTWGVSTFGQSSVLVFPLPLPSGLQFDRMLQYVSVSQSTSSNSSYSIAIEFHAGIYTKNASTLSLLLSGSANNAWSMTSNNTTANQDGARMITAAIQTTLTAGNYWVGVISITKTTGANWATLSQLAMTAPNSIYSGPLGVASNQSLQSRLGYGKFTAVSAAMPVSMAFSDISEAGATLGQRAFPIVNIVNGTMP